MRSAIILVLGAIIIEALTADQIELLVGAAFFAMLLWPTTEQ